MQLFRKPTVVETIAVIAIVGLLAALLLPDSGTLIRWKLERRAREWKRQSVPVLSDQSLMATNMVMSGEWIHLGRHDYTSFSFVKRTDASYDVQFSTSGCMGGCKLSRIASLNNGVITLNGAVAESVSRTYDTLYAIRINDADYLLPAPSVAKFERERAAGTDDWKRYVLQRPDTPNEQTHADDPAAGPDLNEKSSPPSAPTR